MWRENRLSAFLLILLLGLAGCSRDEEEIASEAAPDIEITYEEKTTFTEAESLDELETECLVGRLERLHSGTMVQVVAENVTGSGVIVWETEEELFLVTAAHVLAKQPEKVRVRLIDEIQVDCVEYQMAEHADLALLRISKEEIAEYQVAVMAADDTGAQTGSLIAVMGSRTAAASQIQEGMVLEPWIYVEDYGQHMLLLQAELTMGMSGGGVFDQEEELIGIISGTNEYGEAVAVPVSVLRTEFEELFQ